MILPVKGGYNLPKCDSCHLLECKWHYVFGNFVCAAGAELTATDRREILLRGDKEDE